MLGFLIAVISGALMSVQGVFNTGVNKQAGIWPASAFVQFTALLFCLAAWFFTGREGKFSGLFQVEHKYMLLGGVMGALITYTVIKSVETLGPARSVMFILIAQMVFAYLIELFGLFGVEKAKFEWSKLIGTGIIIAGIVIFQYKK